MTRASAFWGKFVEKIPTDHQEGTAGMAPELILDNIKNKPYS